MQKRKIPPAALAQLIEQTMRALHSLGFDSGLVPAQWTALRYFASPDIAHHTAIQLARYQGIAFGPVSRTVRTLISKGLLEKGGSAGRGRAEFVRLTARGLELLAHDPLDLVTRALAQVDEADKEAMAKGLEAILKAVHSRGEP